MGLVMCMDLEPVMQTEARKKRKYHILTHMYRIQEVWCAVVHRVTKSQGHDLVTEQQTESRKMLQMSMLAGRE